MTALEPPAIPLSSPMNGTLVSADGLPDLNGTATTPTPAASALFDPAVLRAYLLILLPAVFGVAPSDLEDQIFDADFDERVVRFAGEGGGPLYVVKMKDEVEGARVLRFIIFSRWYMLI